MAECNRRSQFISFSGLRGLLLLVVFFCSGHVHHTLGVDVGINYGHIGNNHPSAIRVAGFLHSLNTSKVRFYDGDPNVLSAFRNSNIEFTIGIGNEYVLNITDLTKITCITVGNEVYTGSDAVLISNLLPAMQSTYQALASFSLDKQVYVTTAHSVAILENSNPPSSGSFRPYLIGYIQPLLNFHSMTKFPFLVNVYPFFAYKASPDSVPLDYILFQPNSGITDPNTNLKYDNMLYAQIDSVNSAIKAMVHNEIDVKTSEIGWP